MTPSKEDEVGFASQKWVWFPHETNVFMKGYIVETDDTPVDDVVTVQCEKTGQTMKIKRDKLEKVNPPKFDKCDDMASLTYLNEPSVLHNLGLRYKEDSIYTYSGLFLVAINPYKTLNIYNRDFITLHHKRSHDDENKPKPHIFAITENAYQNLIKDNQHQSILVTGESGAGKTENTKKIIQYLTSITSSNLKDENDFNFEQKILEANPILESFGNSQTLKNNNSSRFGKFIKLEFNPATEKLTGANIEWYLLEKSRVVHQDPNERNYHIFYQLLNGLSDHELAALNLKRSVSHYNYLKNANFTIPGVDDKKEYEYLIGALKTVNFELKEIANIIKVLAIILLLGNIEFTLVKGDKQAILDDSSPIKELCKLLEISDTQLFVNCFIKPKVRAGKELVTQQRNSKQAKFAIDALSKSLYEKIFEYVVNGINKSFIKDGSDSNTKTKFIGILDIAGFEIFPKNSFEQLCINYTNEKLQQFFNHHMFVLEQNEYLKENINWKFIDFGNDLIPTIDLIEKKSKNEIGIFAILDEECIVPNSSDKSFFEKLNSNLENKDKSVKKETLKYRPNKSRTGFVVKHYAGEVEYDIEGWLDKNRDPLSDAVVDLLYNKSNNQFVKSFYQEEAQDVLQSQGSKKKLNKKSSMLRTVASRHGTQLKDLMDQLGSTNPHFVRCILPNNNKNPGEFDDVLILDQLRCNGVLEGIRIARAGFPNRISFLEFYERYRILCKNQSLFSKSIKNSTLKQNCELLLGELQLDSEIFKVGATKLFFKNGVLADLEKKREHTIEKLMIQFQSVLRGKLNRDIFKQKLLKLQASQVIAENFKKFNGLKEDPWFSLFVKLKPLVESTDSSADKKVFNDKIKRLKEEITVLKKENSSMQTETKQFNSKVDQINESLLKKKELLENKESELETLKKHEIELEQKLAAKVSELQKIKIDLDNILEENKELKLKFSESTKNFEVGQKLVDQLNNEKNSLTSKLQDLSTALQTLKSTHSKSKEEFDRLTQEVKMLKGTVKGKESRIKDLEESFATSTKSLEEKLFNATNGYNNASKKLKDAINEKDELQLQLSKLRTSNNTVDNVIKQKEDQLKALTKDITNEKVKIEEIENDRDSLKSKYTKVKMELFNANEELKKLAKKHQKLQHDLAQSRSLLDSKIEDDVKFGRGKQVHDRDILELKETIIDLRDRLTSNYGNNDEVGSTMRSLKYENEQLLKMKKNLDIKIAELTFQIRNRQNSPMIEDTRVFNDITDIHSSAQLELNEVQANLTKITLENKHLKEEVSLMQTRLASESYENRQLKLELSKINKANGVDNDENRWSWSPRPNSVELRQNSRESAELRLQLDSEKRANKRIELLNISLQKELLQYKNQQYNGEKRLSGTTSDTEEDYKIKFEMAESRINELELQLKEMVSMPLKDATHSVLNGSSSRLTTTFQTENLRLNAKLNELSAQLKRSKHSDNVPGIREEDLDILRSKIGILESSNADLSSSVQLYKSRSDEYYNKLEAADAAVKVARRGEESSKRQKLEMKSALETLQKESKLNDIQMVKLNSKVRDLEQKLSDLEFSNQKLTKSLDLLKEKYQVEEEFRSSTSSATSETYERQLKKLNEELNERSGHETEMSKTIKYLSLELDDTKSKASDYENQVLELSKLKSQLEKKTFTMQQENEKLSIKQREVENKLETLVSQLNALRSINEDVIVERDQLLDTKRSLELKVKSVTDEFEKFLAKNNEEIASKVSINELTNDLSKERELSLELDKKLTDIESQRKKLIEDYNSIKQDSITMVEENKALTKFNKQMLEKMKEVETKAKSEIENINVTWQERVKRLESKLSKLMESKINEEQNIYNMSKLTKDLKFKYEEQQYLTSRYRKENDELDNKVSELNRELENLRNEESKMALLSKRAERELNEYKETCLKLEKELLNWKNM